MAPPVNNLLAALARHPDLDPQAVRAVSTVESGLDPYAVGDQGSSFGYFQLHRGGALPNVANPRAWAASPAGIEYALSRISGVAGGLKGPAAVQAIVRRFERPADPSGEIARALAAYGGNPGSYTLPATPKGGVGGGGAGAPVPTSATAANDPRLLSVLLATRQAVGLPAPGQALARALQARQAPTGGSTVHSIAGGTAGPSSSHGGIAELLREGTGGPTHSTGPHVHAAFTDPQLELAAIQWAQQHGLHVGENPYVGDTVDPVHAPNSFHIRNFPGKYNGRTLGQAIDVSGGNTGPFYSWLAGRR